MGIKTEGLSKIPTSVFREFPIDPLRFKSDKKSAFLRMFMFEDTFLSSTISLQK